MFPQLGFAGQARELAGLFTQSCLPFSGHPGALRRWTADQRLPLVPDPARKTFLGEAEGQVFDGSNAAGKFVLISADDGRCTVVTDRSADRETTEALGRALRDAGVTLRLVGEHTNGSRGELHEREYLAVRRNRAWRIQLRTASDGREGRAAVSAVPSSPSQ